MLSKYHVMIADLYNVPFGNVEKLIPDVFEEKMCVLHHQNLRLFI